jgi:Plasmid replication region DNA-binding N-term
MDATLSPDAALAADIDRLKIAFPKTRELYREVCALLFFRHGITPTANRLYQLVRRGSMGTPTAVLGEFWAELREKSRVRIEHPDLPTDLGAAAGELIAVLWTRASASAAASLDALRDEVELQRANAQQSVTAARDELGRVETALEQRTAALLLAQVEVRDLEKALAEGYAQRQALEASVTRLQRENGERDAALAQARVDFAQELQKLREDAQRSEERLRASEKRALLEIERERATAVRLQKELDMAMQRIEQHDERHRAETATLRSQLGDARHQVGLLQGRLDAIETTSAEHVREIGNLRQQLAASTPPSTSSTAPRAPVPRRRAVAKRSGGPVSRRRGSNGPQE